MNNDTLFAQFYQGINWNAISYITYKITATFFTFLLYARLNTHDFSTWANINALVFIVLLWTDFGFRKSIARFSPEFSKNTMAQTRFLTYLLCFQAGALIIVMPLYFYMAHTVVNLLHLEHHLNFFYYGGVLFFIEGIIAVLRLVYHAHFWNKHFNLLQIILLTLEMTTNITLIIFYKDSSTLLLGIIITKLCSGCLTIMLAIPMLLKLYKSKQNLQHHIIDTTYYTKAFIKHSGIMWFNTNAKSLSERNFLVPLFTRFFGPEVANLYKVANDGALFFHRIVLKTIGTTDTALLSHVQTLPERETLMPTAFEKLMKQIITMIIPITIILILLLLKKDFLFHNSFVFKVFFYRSCWTFTRNGTIAL